MTVVRLAVVYRNRSPDSHKNKLTVCAILKSAFGSKYTMRSESVPGTWDRVRHEKNFGRKKPVVLASNEQE